MKKTKRFFIVAGIIAAIAGVLLLGYLFLVHQGVIVFDHSAIVSFEGLYWKGEWYDQVQGSFTSDKRLAQSEDGAWSIYSVKEDPSHNFVYAGSFIDGQLYVKRSYNIPTKGEITAAELNFRKINDQDFLEVLNKIEAEMVTNFEYEIDTILTHTDDHRLYQLFVAYEDCPITTRYKGYIGTVDGKWVITTKIPLDQFNEDGTSKKATFGFYIIPDEYVASIEKCFK